jgi:hypothetical protein
MIVKRKVADAANKLKGHPVCNGVTVSCSDLRLREDGSDILLQVIDKKVKEYKVNRDYIQTLLADYHLPDYFWEILSNESIVSVANDYLLSKESERMKIAVNECH